MANDPEIIPLRAFNDNYIWLLRSDNHAVAVDPGDAAPVAAYLEKHGLALAAILVTHHHGDHIGGIKTLLTKYEAPVYGPAAESIEVVDMPLGDGDRVELPEIGTSFEVIAVPGHTRGHLAYYGRKLHGCGALFCGDTLFACGCGKVIEGTPQQMWHSLSRLAALPGATHAYCAHEYTQANIRFALAVEPDNAALRARAEKVARLRAADLPTLPTTLADELATNPFLRWDAPAVVDAAGRRSGAPPATPDAVFATIREWKNSF